MIVLLDTSSPVCKLGIVVDANIVWHEWEAHRELAHGLLQYIVTTLEQYNETLAGLTGIAVYKGPGSFTGLRIGLTVANTLADSKHIPIIGESGENWYNSALVRLRANENDQIVMPEYGGEAHITKPRK